MYCGGFEKLTHFFFFSGEGRGTFIVSTLDNSLQQLHLHVLIYFAKCVPPSPLQSEGVGCQSA